MFSLLVNANENPYLPNNSKIINKAGSTIFKQIELKSPLLIGEADYTEAGNLSARFKYIIHCRLPVWTDLN